jgi:hypothetical protein
VVQQLVHDVVLRVRPQLDVQLIVEGENDFGRRHVLEPVVGQQLLGPVREIRAGVFVADILLARTLDLGETLTFEYWYTYRFPGDPADPGERQYRRAVLRQLSNLDMRIEFHPDRLPRQVWWAHWDGVDGRVLEREALSLDTQYAAHRYLHALSKTVAGFYWDLPPALTRR